MIQRLSAILLLAAGLCSPSFAVTKNKTFQSYNFSKGLDTYHTPVALADGYVQDSLNILFDDVAPATKRGGFTVAWSTKAYSYTALWTYTDSTNTTWQIARSSDQITANNLAGVSVKIATVSVNNVVGETNAFGSAYFVDQGQGVYSWNGSSTTYATGSPLGSSITSFHGRLWVTGAAIPNGSQLYGSGYFAGNTWTTGLNPTDPVQYSIGLQDNFDNTTAEYVYLDTLYIFKHSSIYALYGFDQTSFQISQLTQECGCIDGGSIQTYNLGLKFASQRGIEHFNGYSCKRISDPIKNKIDPAIQVSGLAASSWVQSQTADWQAGTLSSLDTTSYAPALSIAAVSSTTLPNNSFESAFTNWTQTSGWAAITTTSTIIQDSIGSTIYSCALSPYNGSYMAQSGNAISGAQIVYSTSTSVQISSGSITYSGSYNTGGSFSGYPNCQWSGNSISVPGWAYGLSAKVIFTDGNGDTITSGSFILSGASINFVTSVAQQIIKVGGGFNFYNTYELDYVNGYVVASSSYSTGTFRSQIHTIPSIKTWGSFFVSSTDNGGSTAFSVCSSPNSNMVPKTCAAQAKNSQITITTATYVQWNSTFTANVGSFPTLSRAEVQWFSGNLAIPMSSTIWDNRYWLSITTTTTDSGNDTVMVLNQAGAWSQYDIHAGAFTQYKNSLYHADSSGTGNVYLDNQGWGDNGNAISTYIKTRDESLGDLSSDDYLYALYPSATSTGNCAMSVQYTVDSSSITYSLGSPLLSEFDSMSSVRLPFPIDSSHQDFGQTVDFLLGTNDSQCGWEFIGLTGLYKSRPTQ